MTTQIDKDILKGIIIAPVAILLIALRIREDQRGRLVDTQQ